MLVLVIVIFASKYGFVSSSYSGLDSCMSHRIWYVRHMVVKNTKFYLYITACYAEYNSYRETTRMFYLENLENRRIFLFALSTNFISSSSIKIRFFLFLSILVSPFSLIHFLSSTFLFTSFSPYVRTCVAHSLRFS